MERLGWLLPILFVLLGFGSCAANFPYKYYGMDRPDGLLLGPSDSDDISITACDPNGDKGRCIVMMEDAFYQLKQKYMELQTQLEACQKQNE